MTRRERIADSSFAWAVSSLALFLAACSRTAPPPDATAVDVAAVKTIVVATNSEDADTCAAAIRTSGAKVLFRSAQHMMLVDKAPTELALAACNAIVAKNEEMVLPKVPSERTELSTLLKLIPAEEIGARSFVAAHPNYDGRGVVVAILDTGVEIDHPMLRTTSTGERKVIDVRDFSGEGRVVLTASDAVAGITGSDFRKGTFAGSSLQYSEDVAGKDTFRDLKMIAYRTDAGMRARLDMDGDGDFVEETELGDFSATNKFLKLGAKGTLTAAVNVADDGTSASVVFDDGTHGSHVAGIAAGYDANGLQGVAPGAQVLSAKIGDNRLAGGSTTTASMLLAIDYAASHGAHIVNLSYGIRAGSNLGASAIDRYVDAVAREKGVLFSISAGNEGPGLLTIGVPAGANLAITNGAYVSAATARDNYGYLGMEDETIWWFSSVGPRLDGGMKPSLLAPGSALSSVPQWFGQQANFRGTSMASPHTTGGLALLVSAAQQAGLPTDRASITRAVYGSARKIASLAVVEQGHGLMNVPGAFKDLADRKAELATEYAISATSPASPGGAGAGIYLRGRKLPFGPLNVTVTPQFPAGTSVEEKTKLRSFHLETSAPWLHAPATLWMGEAARTFQTSIDESLFTKPGLHSAQLTAVDEQTGRPVFVVPVTVVVPHLLSEANAHTLALEGRAKVGQTLRYFVELPAGTTAVHVDLSSDGATVWGQLLDPEGRKVLALDDTTRPAPLPPLLRQAEIARAGVYEIDVVAPPTNARPTNVKLRVQAFSLTALVDGDLPGGGQRVAVQNNFEPLRLRIDSETRLLRRKRTIEVAGDGIKLPFHVSEGDRAKIASLHFTVKTAKVYYDLMTDYPYRVFDPFRKMLSMGGLELDSTIEVTPADTVVGEHELEITGAFTKVAPEPWAFQLTEDRILATPLGVVEGRATTLESGQTTTVEAPVALEAADGLEAEGFTPCSTLRIATTEGRALQKLDLCR